MMLTRLLAISLLFWFLLHEPIISVVNRPVLVAGIPLLYLYLFSIWGLLIVLITVTLYRHTTLTDSADNTNNDANASNE